MKMSSRWLVALALLVAGSASAQSVASVYQNPRMSGRTYAKILVVGAHADVERRRRFEKEVVRSLGALGIGAISALENLGDQALNRDVLAAAARNTGADAVLITRLIEAQMNEDVARSAPVSADRREDQPLTDFFRDEYTPARDPMAVGTVRAVIVASDLYDVASEKRVWSGQSTAFAKDTVDAGIAGVAESVTRVLRAGGWLD
jgi:hypothetical protein